MKPESEQRHAVTSGQHVPTKRGDAELEPHADFKWAEVFADLDGAELRSVAELDQDEVKRLASALSSVLAWILEAPVRKGYDAQVGRRAIALCWIVSPYLIEGSPSLNALANRMEMPSGRVLLSRHAVAARKKFGVNNPLQRAHDWRNN